MRRFVISMLCSAAMVAFGLLTAAPAVAQLYGVYNPPAYGVPTYGVYGNPAYGAYVAPAYGAYNAPLYLNNGYNDYAPPSVISGSGLTYGQYSPALNGRYYNSNRFPQYSLPYRYQTYNNPGSISRLSYYGGYYNYGQPAFGTYPNNYYNYNYNPTSRVYSSGSRIYGTTAPGFGIQNGVPYGATRNANNVIYAPSRGVQPRIRYKFVQ